MNRFCLLLVAALISTASLAQKISDVDVVITPSLAEEGELAYSESPLTWDEFKGNPDNSCQYIAMTYSGIKMKYEYKTRNGLATARVLVCPYMDIKQSWYKAEGHNNPTLAHEQRHFDITALVANEFAQEVKNMSFNVSSFAADIDRLTEMQKKYDQETEHGIRHEEQALWDKQLKREIRKALDRS
jgi:hypothetical protein